MSFILHIMRHGKAEPGDGSADSARRLTERGCRETADAARQLAPLLPGPPLVSASPYSRAQQTAAIACQHLQIARYHTDPGLVPGGQPQTLIAGLADHDSQQPLLWVSHMPLVALLVATLCDQPPAHFRTAMIARIQIDAPLPGGGTLLDCITAK